MNDEINNGDEKLYHYTSIESLFYILKNKTIRFNNLTRVDDLEEKESSDLGDFGKFAFVSCYTYNSEDNLPMWHMYSKGMTGVRIEFPCDFFDYEKAKIKINKEFQPHKLKVVGIEGIPPIAKIDIKYTDDESLLYPKLFDEGNVAFPLTLNRLGKHKRKIWEFEQEVRYIIYTQLENWYGQKDTLLEAKKKLITYNQRLNEIFIPIKKEIIKDIKILIGPKATSFDVETVHLLAREYGIPIKNIENSALTKKIQ